MYVHWQAQNFVLHLLYIFQVKRQNMLYNGVDGHTGGSPFISNFHRLTLINMATLETLIPIWRINGPEINKKAAWMKDNKQFLKNEIKTNVVTASSEKVC